MTNGFMQSLHQRILKLPAYTLLFLALSLTATATYFAHLKTNAEKEVRQDRLSRRIGAAIEARLNVYMNALRHTRSLLITNPETSREKFREFIESMELHSRYPGIQGIGYTVRVPAEKLKEHIRQIRAEGFPTYEIWPSEPRDEYFSIIYLEPFNDRNRRAFGYDMFTQPTRREAMARARDTGHEALSGKVILVQETGIDVQNGFLIFLPVYEPGMPVATVEQRRAALRGFVYSPFRASDLFSEILTEQTRHGLEANFEVFSGEELSDETLIYTPFAQSLIHDPTQKPEDFEIVRLELAGHTWTVLISPLEAFHRATSRLLPVSIFIFGAIVSFLIFAFVRLATEYSHSAVKSKNQMQLITDALPVLIAYIDHRERHRFTNRSYEEWFHQPAGSILGRKISDTQGPDHYFWKEEYIQRALQGRVVRFEAEIPHPKKGIRKVQTEFIPDIRDGDEVHGFVILGTDITERKQFEEKIQEERRLVEIASEVGLSLRAELNLDRVAQVITDSATLLTNAKFGAFFYNVVDDRKEAYTLYAVSGAPREAFSKFQMPRNTKIFGPTFRGERTVRADDITQHPDFGKNPPYHGMPKGHLPVRSYLAVPVISRSGEVIGGLFFGHPEPGIFTERAEKLAEGIAAQAAVAIDNARLYSEAQAINRVKDEFLATLSHELRTPLNVILGHAEILKEEEGNLEEFRESINAIYRNAELQHQIVTDLLDISAVISGKITFHPRKISAERAARNALESIRFTAESKGIKLSFESDATDCEVTADETRLQQVLWNLLSNAVKFTNRGGHIAMKVYQNEGGLCVFEVADTGVGINPEFLPYIFDRFRQEDSTTTRKFGGLGLGLSIARQLVELHGGVIEAHSRGKGQGSLFRVVLPAGDIDQPTPNFESSPPVHLVAENGRSENIDDLLSGIEILVVDDEPDARTLLSVILKKAGALVRIAASADEAIEGLKRDSADLIVSDIGMPGKDGVRMLQEIRAFESKKGSFTPAIALTAFARDDERRKVLAAGYQIHLPKPVKVGSLIRAIRQTLDSSHEA